MAQSKSNYVTISAVKCASLSVIPLVLSTFLCFAPAGITESYGAYGLKIRASPKVSCTKSRSISSSSAPSTSTSTSWFLSKAEVARMARTAFRKMQLRLSSTSNDERGQLKRDPQELNRDDDERQRGEEASQVVVDKVEDSEDYISDLIQRSELLTQMINREFDFSDLQIQDKRSLPILRSIDISKDLSTEGKNIKLMSNPRNIWGSSVSWQVSINECIVLTYLLAYIDALRESAKHTTAARVTSVEEMHVAKDVLTKVRALTKAYDNAVTVNNFSVIRSVESETESGSLTESEIKSETKTVRVKLTETGIRNAKVNAHLDALKTQLRDAYVIYLTKMNQSNASLHGGCPVAPA